MNMYDKVVRERKTEERLRKLDITDIVELVHDLEDEVRELEAYIDRLENAIIRAPCSQNGIPCMWPCDNDPSDHGPCWKQAALGI